MNFTLTIKPDEAYYKEAYNEIISTFKYKKYEPIFATIMILFGLGLYYFDTKGKLGLFPVFFSAVGVYELYKSIYYEKKKWLNARLDSRIARQHIDLEFTDTTIKHTGPFAIGELRWEGLKAIVKTQNGILLKPENGISIYLPNTVFTNLAQVDFIMAKKSEVLNT